MKATLTFLFYLSVALAVKTKYDGYKVYKLSPTTESHVQIINELETREELDFWSDLPRNGGSVDVMVQPTDQDEFEELLNSNELQFTVMIEDVQKLIDIEAEQQARAKARSKLSSRRIQWDQYYNVNEINEYLAYLAATYPNLVTLEQIGLSLEGRGVIFAKLSTNSSAEKPIIVIDGGIHAREWIAPAAVLYILNQLVENATNHYLLSDLDWYILPVLNPDGYEFSIESTRLWRKTRSPGVTCYGTDGNRNFDFFWGTIGASENECSETYRGPSPNSEVETQHLINFVMPVVSRIKLYLSYHSFGDYFLYAYGYTNDPPSNADELQAVGDAAAAAIERVNGRRYTVGQAALTLYPNSGSSRDYFRGALNVPLSYTVELSGDNFGFIWPPERIFSVVQETWESILVFGDYVASTYGQK